MKLEMARGFFLVAALGVSAFAAASWYQPEHGVVSAHGRSFCLDPSLKRSVAPQLQNDGSLLWLVMGLSQGMR